MKIGIFGHFGANNFGDELILETMLMNLESILRPDGILVFTAKPVPNTYEGFKTVKTIYYPGFNLQLIFKTNVIIRAIKSCDVILIGGGGLLQDAHSYKTIPRYLIPVIIAKIFNKKVMYFSVGIGPINSRLLRKTVASISELADIITVRDKYSSDLLKRIGFERKIYVSGDPVFSRQLDFERGSKVINTNNTKLKVGISIRPFNFPKSQIPSLAEFLDYLIDRHNAEIYFLPTETDIAVNQEIYNCMKNDKKKICNYSIHKFLQVIADMNVVIGMRLHILMVGLLCNIPVVGIAYLPKVSALCELFHQPHYTPDSIDWDALKGNFDEIVCKKKLAVDTKKLKRMEQLSLVPYRYIETEKEKRKNYLIILLGKLFSIIVFVLFNVCVGYFRKAMGIIFK